mgnify:CR=1 FL=1
MKSPQVRGARSAHDLRVGGEMPRLPAIGRGTKNSEKRRYEWSASTLACVEAGGAQEPHPEVNDLGVRSVDVVIDTTVHEALR